MKLMSLTPRTYCGDTQVPWVGTHDAPKVIHWPDDLGMATKSQTWHSMHFWTSLMV